MSENTLLEPPNPAYPLVDHWVRCQDDLFAEQKRARIAALERLRAAGRGSAGPLTYAAALADLAQLRWRVGDPHAAEAVLGEADHVLHTMPERPEPAWSHVRAATLLLANEIQFARGWPDTTGGYEEALAVAEKSGDTLAQAQACFGLADLAKRTGHFWTCHRLIQSALDRSRKADHALGIVLSMSHRATFKQDCHQEDPAREEFDRLHGWYQKMGLERGVLYTTYSRGTVLAESEPLQGRELLLSALDMSRRLGDVRWEAYCRLALARAAFNMKDMEAKEAEHAECIRLSRAIQDHELWGACSMRNAMDAREAKDWDRQLRLNREAARILESAQAWVALGLVIGNQAMGANGLDPIFGAQALWLAIQRQLLPSNIAIFGNLVAFGLGNRSPLAARAAAYAWTTLATRGGLDRNEDYVRDQVLHALVGCAVQQSDLPPPDRRHRPRDYRGKMVRWLSRMGWHDGEKLGRELKQDLELLVPEDAWWFDYRKVEPAVGDRRAR